MRRFLFCTCSNGFFLITDNRNVYLVVWRAWSQSEVIFSVSQVGVVEFVSPHLFLWFKGIYSVALPHFNWNWQNYNFKVYCETHFRKEHYWIFVKICVLLIFFVNPHLSFLDYTLKPNEIHPHKVLTDVSL